MYVTAISPRFSLGRSTPATLAMVSPRARSSAGFAGAILLCLCPGGGIGGGHPGPLRSSLYPCRCLCRGFLQMIRTTPRRLTILQCSQRTLTDGRTFISSLLLEPVRDPAPCEVVRRQLDLHAVPRQDADEVHAHLAAHVREHAVAALQLHAEHRVRQRLHDGALDLDRVFFGHAPLTPPGRSGPSGGVGGARSEEHRSELQSHGDPVG